MAKFIFKIFLITFLLLGISLLCSPIFLKKELLRTNNIYLLEEDNDILFVGSSHVFATIDVDFLESAIDANTFLLATPSQNISQSYYLIKEFLKYKSPKIIFLETYSLKEYAGDDFVSHAAYDGLKLSKLKIEAAYDASFNDSTLDLYRFSSLIIPFYKYHNRWDGDITESDFSYFKNVILNKGSEIPSSSSVFEPTDQDYIDYNLSSIDEESTLATNIEDKLKDIIELCEHNNIKLVLFSTPYLAHHGYSVENQIKNINYLKNKFKNEHVNFLDFNLLYKEIDINYNDFVDNHHLNNKGAKKVNTYLESWIVKNYKNVLPNRESEKLWYRYLDKRLTTKEVVFEKETHFKTQDGISIESIAFLKEHDNTYIIIDVNDDLNIVNFNNEISSDNLRMMVHLYPDEKDIDKGTFRKRLIF